MGLEEEGETVEGYGDVPPPPEEDWTVEFFGSEAPDVVYNRQKEGTSGDDKLKLKSKNRDVYGWSVYLNEGDDDVRSGKLDDDILGG